jgi:hypothetical protein
VIRGRVISRHPPETGHESSQGINRIGGTALSEVQLGLFRPVDQRQGWLGVSPQLPLALSHVGRDRPGGALTAVRGALYAGGR